MTVYFIKPVNLVGPIKIGCSGSPDSRARTLNTWSPFALKIVATVHGDMQLERRFHARFAHLHERREWFSWAPELAEAIAAIREGAFDIGTLPEGRHITGRTGQKRDTSFATVEWRYRRSVQARVVGMRLRGMKWNASDRRHIDELCAGHVGNALANRDQIEAIFVELDARFPRKLPALRLVA